MGLSAENRHNYILDCLKNNGKVIVKETAEKFGVTEVTIRRDLASLETKGLVKKTYGGAVLAGTEFNPSVRFRHTKNLSAKKIIGKLAADIVKDGDNIYLEAGSTCYEIIPYLADKKNLTIITNSLMLMSRLHEQPQHRVIVTGGQYRSDTMDMIGPPAENTISQLGGFTSFTSADDISIGYGISGADVATVSFVKQVLKRAARAVFVGTRNKFDRGALYKIVDLDDLDYIVTNACPGDAWERFAKEHNITLFYPAEAVHEDLQPEF
ncbi:MAG: DeoR/GlpR family DNA-binding transcription regulator [Phycisphaerae bacterium]|jgi:DeoR family fructose operon transcriptional repressor